MFRFLPLVLLVLVVAGVPDVGFAVELMATPQAKFSLQPAKAYYAAGQSEAALSTLRRYILESSDSPYLPEAYALIGRILLEQQRDGDALFYLQRIPTEQLSAEASLLLVDALQKQQQPEAASEIVTGLTAEQFTGKDLSLYYQLKSDDLMFRQQPLQALVVLRMALQHGDLHDRMGVFEQIQQILKCLDQAEADEVSFMFAATELNDAMTLLKAQTALENGDDGLARQLVQPLIASAQVVAAKIGAARVLDQISGQRWQQRAVGVVLPLSGRYAPFGELVRKGIELAISEFATEPVRFIYLDSQADAKLAAKAVDELVNGDRVLAVIGPLMGDGALESVAIAEAAKVPLITLSHRQGLPEMGEYIFRNSLTTQQQVDTLADYAIDVLGLNTYAILAPDSRAGQEFSQQFASAIEDRGGDIEYRLTFKEQATDFRRQLLIMKGEDPDAPQQDHDIAVAPEADGEELVDGEDIQIEEKPDWLPTVDFEALFIPAYADSVALIAPQLAYYGIENVQLFGMNGWNSPKLIQQAGRYTQGAIFSDGFYANSQEPQVARFVEQFKDRFSESPSIIEAQAYDCAKIVLTTLSQPEVTTSESLHQALYLFDDFKGITGIEGFDGQGEAKRQPILIQMGRRYLNQLHWVVEPETAVEGDLVEKMDSSQTSKR